MEKKSFFFYKSCFTKFDQDQNTYEYFLNSKNSLETKCVHVYIYKPLNRR